MTDYPIKSPRKLIEVALPLDAINVACAREKSIRHGHPSTLHLWWARRPLAAARAAGKFKFDGAIVLGCVIRGETAHYDIVCNNANHWLYTVANEFGMPIGNAILTVDTHEQAMARASGGRAGKGGDAAYACLSLIALRRKLQSEV